MKWKTKWKPGVGPGEDDDPLPILYQEQNTYIILDVEEALEAQETFPGSLKVNILYFFVI